MIIPETMYSMYVAILYWLENNKKIVYILYRLTKNKTMLALVCLNSQMQNPGIGGATVYENSCHIIFQ